MQERKAATDLMLKLHCTNISQMSLLFEVPWKATPMQAAHMSRDADRLPDVIWESGKPSASLLIWADCIGLASNCCKE